MLRNVILILGIVFMGLSGPVGARQLLEERTAVGLAPKKFSNVSMPGEEKKDFLSRPFILTTQDMQGFARGFYNGLMIVFNLFETTEPFITTGLGVLLGDDPSFQTFKDVTKIVKAVSGGLQVLGKFFRFQQQAFLS